MKMVQGDALQAVHVPSEEEIVIMMKIVLVRSNVATTIVNWNLASFRKNTSGGISTMIAVHTPTTSATRSCCTQSLEKLAAPPPTPCPHGHGECEKDADCEGSLICGDKNCFQFYDDAGPRDDCCVYPKLAWVGGPHDWHTLAMQN